MTPILAKSYYKNDYDLVLRLKDCLGRDIGWPTFDWSARIYTAGSKANAHTASCVGGVCRNCVNDGGRIRVFIDNDRPSPGPVVVEFEGLIPDAGFPDGFRKVATRFSANLTLTSETEVSLGAATEVPVPAGTLQALTRIAADVDSGKRRVAEALTAQGVPTGADEPLSEMADKVLGLRLAVEGQPGIADQTLGGVLPTYDLLNELRNHLRADYPYCCGVMFPRTEPAVELKMADAYLCSDGFFTEEQDVTHELADTDRDMSYVIYYFRERRYTVPTYISPILRAYALNGHPCWALNKLIPDIRSYSEDLAGYESADIVVANNSFQHLTLAGVRVLNLSVAFAQSCSNLVSLCLPDLEELLSSNQSRLVDNGSVYAIHLPKLRMMDGPALLVNFVSSLERVDLPCLEKLAGNGYLFSQTSRLSSVSLPLLAELSGSVASNCAALTELSLPALETITGGTLASNCAALTELSLPALETITGGTLASNCAALTELSLPALETITGGTLASNCAALTELSLPALETAEGGSGLTTNCTELQALNVPKLRQAGFRNTEWYLLGSGLRINQDLYVEAPSLEYLRCYLHGGSSALWGGMVHVRLGAIDGGYFQFRFNIGADGSKVTVSVRPGFRSTLIIPNLKDMTGDQLRDIIANLGDNTGYPTLALTLGADNLAKLSQEDIAAATSKNYTLS